MLWKLLETWLCDENGGVVAWGAIHSIGEAKGGVVAHWLCDGSGGVGCGVVVWWFDSRCGSKYRHGCSLINYVDIRLV